MSVDQLLTPKQLAARTTIAESTLCDWRKKGYGPRWIPLGRRVGYPESDVNAWLEQQRDAVGRVA